MPSEKDNKRFYWLKLEKDFFKRHDIRVVESMPNGKDYILFYLKLLCESTSHEGYLRFSPTIPYSEDMLATITNTNVDVVRTAIKIFTELKMMEVLDDGTFYLQQVQKMIGSATGQTIRKAESKDRKLLGGNSVVKSTTEIDIDIEKDKEKELEIDIDTNKELDLDSSLLGNRDNSKNLHPFTEPLVNRLIEAGYITKGSMEDIEITNFVIEKILRDGTKEPLELSNIIKQFIQDIKNVDEEEITNKANYLKEYILDEDNLPF